MRDQHIENPAVWEEGEGGRGGFAVVVSRQGRKVCDG